MNSSGIRSATGSGAPTSSRRRRARLIVVTLAAAVPLSLILLLTALTGDDPEEVVAAPTTTTSPPSLIPRTTTTETVDPEPDCRSDAADQSSAEDVAAAFEYAIFTLRSAETARGLVAPDADGLIGTVDNLRGAVEASKPGTTYCVVAIETAPSRVRVELTVTEPETPAVLYRQQMTTVEVDGRHFISSIVDAVDG